jgi:NhaP-type Na+/H+ or K+/H+ antiporter
MLGRRRTKWPTLYKTPTNSFYRFPGKFADKNIPPALQKIIIAESGANDGLGYPFLFLALYLVKYTGMHGLGVEGDAGTAIGLWFSETWAYTILLSVAYGAVVGYFAKELLHWAEDRRYVDRESFLVFAITLAVRYISIHRLMSGLIPFSSSSS